MRDGIDLRLAGSEFQSLGAAKRKALSTKLFRLDFRTTGRFFDLEMLLTFFMWQCNDVTDLLRLNHSVVVVHYYSKRLA